MKMSKVIGQFICKDRRNEA